MTPACEDRGADLFVLARDGAEPAVGLAEHLAGCEPCRTEVHHLRRLARDLPAATGRLRPRPSTKTDLMKEIDAVLAEEAPPPPPRLRRPPLSFWFPAGLLAASVLATLWVLRPGEREGDRPDLSVEGGSVDVRPVFGGSALEGLAGATLRRGSELSAKGIASVHLGPPLDADVVLGPGTAVRLPAATAAATAPGAPPTLELLRGVAWFSPSGAAPPVVLAGDLRVSGRAVYTVERRAGGLVSVLVESGTALLRVGEHRVEAVGPCRVEVPPGGDPGDPIPAEAADAAAWFAYPEFTLELEADRPGEPREMLLTLRPSVPHPLSIAPWDRYDPLFSLRITHAERGLHEMQVGPRLLSRPSPRAEGDGSFLLGPDRHYRLRLDARRLGLEPGTYSVAAVYAANRSGGTWRGTRASNAVELVVK